MLTAPKAAWPASTFWLASVQRAAHMAECAGPYARALARRSLAARAGREGRLFLWNKASGACARETGLAGGAAVGALKSHLWDVRALAGAPPAQWLSVCAGSEAPVDAALDRAGAQGAQRAPAEDGGDERWGDVSWAQLQAWVEDLLTREERAAAADYPERLHRHERRVAQHVEGWGQVVDRARLFQPTDRVIICNWLQELFHELGKPRETLQRTMAVFDRFFELHTAALERRPLDCTSMAFLPVPLRPVPARPEPDPPDPPKPVVPVAHALPRPAAPDDSSRLTRVDSSRERNGLDSGRAADSGTADCSPRRAARAKEAGGARREYRPARTDLQLVAVAAAGVVLKHDTDIDRSRPMLSQLAEYTRGAVTAAQLRTFEPELLMAIDYRLEAPTLEEALTLFLQILVFWLVAALARLDPASDEFRVLRADVDEVIAPATFGWFGGVMDALVADARALELRPSTLAACLLRTRFPRWSTLTARITGMPLGPDGASALGLVLAVATAASAAGPAPTCGPGSPQVDGCAACRKTRTPPAGRRADPLDPETKSKSGRKPSDWALAKPLLLQPHVPDAASAIARSLSAPIPYPALATLVMRSTEMAHCKTERACATVKTAS
jgi:hypothetical protein